MFKKKVSFLLSCLFVIWVAGSALGAPTISALYPEDNDENVPIGTSVVWKMVSGDQDISSQYRYNVKFGSTSLPTVSTAQSSTSYTPPTNLQYGATYRWLIEAVSGDELLTTSDVFTFSTPSASAATEFTFEAIDPLDDPQLDKEEGYFATTNSIKWKVKVKVKVGDEEIDDICCGKTYKIRVGESASTMVEMPEVLSEPVYKADLGYDKVYYWQIVGSWTNELGQVFTCAGPIWSFRTVHDPERGSISGGCNIGTSALGIAVFLIPALGMFVSRMK